MTPGSTVRPARSTTVAFFAWPWTWASGPTRRCVRLPRGCRRSPAARPTARRSGGRLSRGSVGTAGCPATGPGRRCRSTGRRARTVSWTVLLHDHPALHHERHLLERRDVAERIAVYGDHVGVAARLERADPVRPPHQVGRVHGGGLDRLHRGQPPANHMGELFRVPAVRIHAGVRAERDLHAGAHRALEVLALRAADQTLLVDGLLRIPEARIFGEDVVVVVDIRDEVRALLLHEADPFVVEERAVLDRGAG